MDKTLTHSRMHGVRLLLSPQVKMDTIRSLLSPQVKMDSIRPLLSPQVKIDSIKSLPNLCEFMKSFLPSEHVFNLVYILHFTLVSVVTGGYYIPYTDRKL